MPSNVEQGQTLASLIRAAWATGTSLDLGAAAYGRATRDGKEVHIQSPSTYYPFLAGLVRETRASTVLEIGTNCGGSALAMLAGFENDDGMIVTCDVNDYSDPYLAGTRRIHKVQGDANSQQTIEEIVDSLGDRELDILYIDAAHSYMPTLLNFSIYGSLLTPKHVVLDDITLYASMKDMWNLIMRARGSENAVNAAEIVPEIRPQTPPPGFGVVRYMTRDAVSGT